MQGESDELRRAADDAEGELSAVHERLADKDDGKAEELRYECRGLCRCWLRPSLLVVTTAASQGTWKFVAVVCVTTNLACLHITVSPVCS